MKRKKTLGFRFAVLHRLYTYILKEDLTEVNLQTSEVPYIATLLKASGSMIQDELTELLAIDKAAAARSLASLEKKGFIHRKVNPENRRQKIVSLTDKSREIQSSIWKILDAPAKDFLRGFSEKEIGELYSYLDRIIKNGTEKKNEIRK